MQAYKESLQLLDAAREANQLAGIFVFRARKFRHTLPEKTATPVSLILLAFRTK